MSDKMAHEYTNKDVRALIDERDALRAQRDALAQAMQFYADPLRYSGPNQLASDGEQYVIGPYRVDVTRDRGEIARAALAKLEEMAR